MNILIGDDDVISRKILMIMLKSYGTCHEAISSEEIIVLFRQCLLEKRSYDVVFLEVSLLPGEVGCNILRKLRQLEEEFGIREADRVTCIMISAAAQESRSDLTAEYKLQGAGYLSKPISPEMLESEFERLKLITPQLAIFNRQQLATLMIDVGDKEIVRELVLKFMAELPEELMDVQKKMIGAEYHYIQKKAHQLVSISGTYGFNQLSEILRSIEQGAIQQEEQTMTDGIVLGMRQWRKIQEPLAEFWAECEVHDGK